MFNVDDEIETAEALSIISPLTITVEPFKVAERSDIRLILYANCAATS